MDGKFSLKKNLCFALNYLFFPVGIILLLTQKAEATKEDKIEIVRGFVLNALMIVVSLFSMLFFAITAAAASIIVVALFLGLIAFAIWVVMLALGVDYVLVIIARFIGKDKLKVPFVDDIVTKIATKFVKQ